MEKLRISGKWIKLVRRQQEIQTWNVYIDTGIYILYTNIIRLIDGLRLTR